VPQAVVAVRLDDDGLRAVGLRPAILSARQECEFVAHFELANGQVVFDRRGAFICTPSP
jgi:hypothetical protein